MDGTIQVRTYEYTDMRRKVDEARVRREVASYALEDARRRLQEVEKELDGTSAADIGQIHRAVKEEEKRLLKDLEQAGEQIRNEVMQQNTALRGELQEVRRSVARTNDEIDRVNGRIREVSRNFESRIRSITEGLQKQGDRARLYANQLQDLLEQISPLHPQLLTPGESELIRETMDFVTTDIQNGDYQAAIGLAQEKLPEAVDLLARLGRLNDEFHSLSASLMYNIFIVRQQIEKLTDAEANEKDLSVAVAGEVFGFRYDGNLDYWSNGQFTLISESFDRLEERIKQEFIPHMDLTNMRTANRDVTVYGFRFARCVVFANDEFLISCRVQGTAIRIDRALTEGDAWTLMDSGFENDDSRQAYHSLYYDGQGNRSAIVVLPSDINSTRSEDEDVINIKEDARVLIGACDGERIRDAALCGILRDAVLARLELHRINIRKDDADREIDSMDGFIEEAYSIGDDAKTGRLQRFRSQIRL